MNAATVPVAELATRSFPAWRTLYWSVRRELSENRYVYIAPAAVGVAFLVGFIVNAIHATLALSAIAAPVVTKQKEVAFSPYDFSGGLLMLTTMVVGAFYSVDALYGERRDRSILFWKSMPVSDLTAVLAKASIPMLLLPLIAFAAACATHVLVFLLSAVIFRGNEAAIGGLSIGGLSFARMELLMLYHFVTVHALWPAPIYAWFILVSAWSRRVPIVWAVLPPIVLCALEKIALNTTHLANVLVSRILGGGPASMEMPGTFPINPGTHITPLLFLTSPGLWVGLVVTTLLLLAAARLRREQGPA